MSSDPFASLSDAGYREATRLAIASDAAEWIRSRIEDALQDQAANGGPSTDYGRGYRHALRVAYLLAGGEVDGSEQGWGTVEGDG